MTLRFSLREHHYGAAGYPNVTFSKPSGSILRANSDTAGSNARAYVFIVAPRTWLHGKYLRFRWQGSSTWSGWATDVRILDGEYVRSSNTDFPDGSEMPTKGNGLLQTLRSKSGSFAWETVDVQANVSGGSQEKCTILFRLSDAWTAQNGYYDVDWFEFNSASGGAGNLYSEPFDANVIMELTGTYGDYGYISSGDITVTYSASTALKAIAKIHHDYDYITVVSPEEVRLDGYATHHPAYLYRAKTFPGQFSIKGEIRLLTGTEIGGGAYFCGMTESVDALQTLLILEQKVLACLIYRADPNYIISVSVQEGPGDNDYGADIDISIDTTYYFHLHRDASSYIHLDVYSDPEFSVLVGSSVANAGAHSTAYSYLYAIDCGGYSGSEEPVRAEKVTLYKLRTIVT